MPLAGGVACIGLVVARNHRTAAAMFAATSVAFVTLLFALGADRADRHQSTPHLLSAIHSHSSRPQIASYKILEPSWVFYGGRTIHEFNGDTAAESRIAAEQAAGFLRSSPDCYLITTERHAGDLLPRLSSETGVLARTPYFLKRDTLVLLGRQPPPLWVAAQRTDGHLPPAPLP
jgi:hypothetical protein